MLNLLVGLIVLLVLLGVAYYVLTLLPVPQPFKNIALAILGIVVLLYLLGVLTGYTTFPVVLR